MPALRRGIDPTDKLVECYRRYGIRAVEATLRIDLAGPTEPDTIYLAWQLILQASRDGLDLVRICHDEGKLVDAWTFNLSDPAAGFSDKEWEAFLAPLALAVDQITTDEALATETAARETPASFAMTNDVTFRLRGEVMRMPPGPKAAVRAVRAEITSGRSSCQSTSWRLSRRALLTISAGTVRERSLRRRVSFRH